MAKKYPDSDHDNNQFVQVSESRESVWEGLKLHVNEWKPEAIPGPR